MQLSIICNIIYLSLLQINIQSYAQEKQLKILQIDDQFRRSAVQVDSRLSVGTHRVCCLQAAKLEGVLLVEISFLLKLFKRFIVQL